MCTGGIHSQGKHHTPVHGTVNQREPHVPVPPDPENHQHGNPPRGAGPEEKREAFDERHHVVKETGFSPV